jgi:hypothetical protein
MNRQEPNVSAIPMLQPGATGHPVLWLNEALAALNELPVQFTPASGAPTAVSAQNVALSTTHQDLSPSLDGIHRSANPVPVFVNRQFSKPSISTILANQLAAGSLDLIPGHWTWVEWYPQSLVQHWNPSTFTVVTEGAIMRFHTVYRWTVLQGPRCIACFVRFPTKSRLCRTLGPRSRESISVRRLRNLNHSGIINSTSDLEDSTSALCGRFQITDLLMVRFAPRNFDSPVNLFQQ